MTTSFCELNFGRFLIYVFGALVIGMLIFETAIYCGSLIVRVLNTFQARKPAPKIPSMQQWGQLKATIHQLDFPADQLMEHSVFDLGNYSGIFTGKKLIIKSKITSKCCSFIVSPQGKLQPLLNAHQSTQSMNFWDMEECVSHLQLCFKQVQVLPDEEEKENLKKNNIK